MTQPRIRAALESRLNTWATTRDPALPVLWQNVTANQPSADHLRAFVMPARIDSLFLDGKHRGYRGVFQVSVFCVAGTGPKKAEGIAEEIATLFPNALTLTESGLQVVIASPMSMALAIEEPGWYSIPVSCRYTADTSV